jgi:hypothetical protein
MRNTSFSTLFENGSRGRGELEVELEIEIKLDGPGADAGASGGGGGALKENSCRCVESQGPMAYWSV